MKQLKFLIFILLAITIFSCYSTETNCLGIEHIVWELASRFPHTSYLEITNDGNIWTHGVGFTLYLSTDNGDTWEHRSTPFSSSLIAVSPINGYLFVGLINVLYISTDNGENWEPRFIANIIFSDILITASGEIYIGGRTDNEKYETVCYYSNDNGNTWTNKNNGLPNLTLIISLALGKDGTLYACTNKGLYRSTNGGGDWIASSSANVSFNGLAICDDGSIFAATNQGVLKSTNKGLSWTKVETRFDVDMIIYNPITKDIFVNSSIYYYNHDWYRDVYRSTNSGEDWLLENNGFPRTISGVLAVNPKTGQMFLGTLFDGVYRTKNYPK